MKVQVHWVLAGLVAATSLAGCLGSTPTTRLYMLEPMTERSATESSQQPATLLVREVRLPHYLDRPQIVTRDENHRLQIAEFDHWGGDLREDMTRILVANLGRDLGSDRVFATPLHAAMKPAYRLDLEILRFERESGGRVRLTARWWLTRGADAGLLLTREASFSGTSAADSYPALVASMSTVYGELASAIADSVRKAGGP
ncbi:MAG: membrane integrity-associated transporter subunit PqiC [Rhodocyclales bacterium]|nr:membrane integrity-associated transporter subunit PqiC [Rhodocyclales bacterium]